MKLIEDDKTWCIPRDGLYVARATIFPNTVTTTVANTYDWKQKRDLVEAICNYYEHGADDAISKYYKHDANEVLKVSEVLSQYSFDEFMEGILGDVMKTFYYNTKEKERARMGEIIWPKVKKIEILKENKVVRVTINNSSYKQICRDGDVFDLRLAVAIALVKNLWGNLTPEGNEYYARHFLLYHKDFSKVVDKAIKAYEKEKREKELEEHRKEEIKKIKERRRAKNAMKRKKKREAAARKE